MLGYQAAGANEDLSQVTSGIGTGSIRLAPSVASRSRLTTRTSAFAAAAARAATAFGATSALAAGITTAVLLAGFAQVFKLLGVDAGELALVAGQTTLGTLGNVQIRVQVRR